MIHVPPSIIILSHRIDHWDEQFALSPCPAYRVHCSAMIAELELIKQKVMEK